MLSGRLQVKKIEERIHELKQLRESANSETAEPILRKALGDKSNLIVAEAAKATEALRLTRLAPALVEAFWRLLENPVKTDPKCWGKTAIVKALIALDYAESAPFMRAASHVQMEPVWGGQEDAAIHLRANAILALVQCNDLSRSDKLRRLVDAMADASDTVRIEAMRAIEQLNGEEGVLLLRLKAHAGDKRSAVIGQVFDSLLQLERERGVDFVARFLQSTDPETRDEAALALGGSRLGAAVTRLIETWKTSHDPAFSATLLRALSSSREESALQFLLDLIANGVSRDATLALAALGLHRESPEILARIEQAQRTRAATERD
jgi:HEAT repeat protein